MKKFLFLSLIFLSMAFTVRADDDGGGKIVESKYFTKQKIYTDDSYALRDFVEFSVFDMSELNLVINGQRVDLSPPEEAVAKIPLSAKPSPKNKKPAQAVPAGRYIDPAHMTPVVTEAPAPKPVSPLEAEIRRLLPEIPKYFYKNLKENIAAERIPVTLYASNPPAYASPMKLYIKLIDITLAPAVQNKKGVLMQPVTIKIYGQLKDRKSDDLLTRFYDEASAEFTLSDKTSSVEAFKDMANETMRDLSLFLKTKY